MASNQPTIAVFPSFPPFPPPVGHQLPICPHFFFFFYLEFIAHCSESLCLKRGLPGSQLPGYSLLPTMSSNCQFILSQPFHHSVETDRLKPPERPEDSAPSSHQLGLQSLPTWQVSRTLSEIQSTLTPSFLRNTGEFCPFFCFGSCINGRRFL